jgi:hypothetical protein
MLSLAESPAVAGAVPLMAAPLVLLVVAEGIVKTELLWKTGIVSDCIG